MTYIFAAFKESVTLNLAQRSFKVIANTWGCSLWSRSVMLGSAGIGKVRLISREIIFQEFQPM